MIEILLDSYCLIHSTDESNIDNPKKIVFIEKKNI